MPGLGLCLQAEHFKLFRMSDGDERDGGFDPAAAGAATAAFGHDDHSLGWLVVEPAARAESFPAGVFFVFDRPQAEDAAGT